jgi:hypothetical protein
MERPRYQGGCPYLGVAVRLMRGRPRASTSPISMTERGTATRASSGGELALVRRGATTAVSAPSASDDLRAVRLNHRAVTARLRLSRLAALDGLHRLCLPVLAGRTHRDLRLFLRHARSPSQSKRCPRFGPGQPGHWCPEFGGWVMYGRTTGASMMGGRDSIASCSS